MPTYSYYCCTCKYTFELFVTIKDYKDTVICDKCKKTSVRDYNSDMLTITSSIKKMDSELKTIGDLAKRNSERMNDDQKISLYQKHNSYKENKIETKPLPKGMKYKKKPAKPKWPGA